jgi:hypothetical protein
MSFLTITRHRCFAVRKKVRLRSLGGEVTSGLMIEVSLETCRIAASAHPGFRLGQVVTLEIEGFGDFRALVRAAGERCLALRFLQSMPIPELHELVRSAGDESRPILKLPAFGAAV